MRQLRVRTYTPAMAPPPVNVGLAVSLNGLCLAELSGCVNPTMAPVPTVSVG